MTTTCVAPAPGDSQASFERSLGNAGIKADAESNAERCGGFADSHAAAATKAQVGDRLCLCGNVDCGLLCTGAPDDVDRATAALLCDCTSGGGFVVRYSTPEWARRIYGVDALGEPQMDKTPQETCDLLRRYELATYPTTVTLSEEQGFRFYAGLSDYPHFDAYQNIDEVGQKTPMSRKSS